MTQNCFALMPRAEEAYVAWSREDDAISGGKGLCFLLRKIGLGQQAQR
ncbi:hypothetical protein LJC19_01155 [Oxalobacter sp. OttesenSCG-928-P03]|nr:hypothetical protein [Oxalobacter sp. OttesenSCG-928-P03]